ncbi:enoyl-CoA hydratase/carnithine racemase [Nocardiopsis mwathae]|uniref:Enoyl-CoA hydratase/carnithine racemase n=1 Tax=Nocardiopsis mwathae TaxID=1472723 RepID=A0A7W9YJN2_9ACTN|nr:enoyl-CoA hydratase-related protein [Nocardiopsis mwathae]MBB6173380.1 enoyl-CoA hydratase/carnithine racemase [Nocardiopsis mwathae]
MMAASASPPRPLRWHLDFTGVVTLVLDRHGHGANLLTGGLIDALSDAVDHLHRSREDITGVILTSAKPTFMLGTAPATLERFACDRRGRDAALGTLRTTLRRLERLGVPVVAAIDGSALGAGFELALACHHRIAVEDDGSRVGLPDADAGLLPLAGGVSRVVHRWGPAAALANLLHEDAAYPPRRARALGLVEEIAPDSDALQHQAEAWIAANPDPVQPWDRLGHRMAAAPATPARPAAPHDASTARATLVSTAYRVAAMAGIDAALAIEQEALGALLAESIRPPHGTERPADTADTAESAESAESAPSDAPDSGGHRTRFSCRTRRGRRDLPPLPASARLLIASPGGDGRPAALSEATPARAEGAAGAVDDFWRTGGGERGVPVVVEDSGPPRGGSVFRMFYLQPDRVRREGTGGRESRQEPDVRRVLGVGGEAADGGPVGVGPGTDAATGYFIVLAGTVVCVLDGREVELGPGDVLVRDRVDHTWSNRGDEPAVLGVVLVGGS